MASASRDADPPKGDRPARRDVPGGHSRAAGRASRSAGPGDARRGRQPAGGGGRSGGQRGSQPTGGPGRGGPRGASGGYVQELGAVLRRRDPLALRAFLAASARRFGNEREGAEIEARESTEMALVMHQMIVARPDLQSLHAESQRWLRGHGLDPDVTGESRRN